MARRTSLEPNPADLITAQSLRWRIAPLPKSSLSIAPSDVNPSNDSRANSISAALLVDRLLPKLIKTSDAELQSSRNNINRLCLRFEHVNVI